MSKQKEVPVATVRFKHLKPLKNHTPYALKTSHFSPQLFHLLLPNSFGPYKCSQAAVLTPESCLRSEEWSQPFRMFVNSLSDLLRDQTLWVLAPFCPWPDTGNWKAALSLRAEFGQLRVFFSEFLFGNQNTRSGRAEGTRLLGASLPNPESKAKLLITRKNHPGSDHLCLPIDPRGESCNCIRLLGCSESISLSYCVQHVDIEKMRHGPRG